MAKNVQTKEEKTQKIFGVILAVLVLVALILLIVVGCNRAKKNNTKKEPENKVTEPIADTDTDDKNEDEEKVVTIPTKTNNKDDKKDKEVVTYRIHYFMDGEEVTDGLDLEYEEGTSLTLKRTFNGKTVRWTPNETEAQRGEKRSIVYKITKGNLGDLLNNDNVINLFAIVISEKEEETVTKIKYVNKVVVDGEEHSEEYVVEYTESEVEELELPVPEQLGMEAPKYYVVSSEKRENTKEVVKVKDEYFDEETMILEEDLKEEEILDESKEVVTIEEVFEENETKIYIEEKEKEFIGWEHPETDAGTFVDKNENNLVDNGEYVPSTTKIEENELVAKWDYKEEDRKDPATEEEKEIKDEGNSSEQTTNSEDVA